MNVYTDRNNGRDRENDRTREGEEERESFHSYVIRMCLVLLHGVYRS